MSRWSAPMQALVSTLSPGARRDIARVDNVSPVPLVPRRRNVFNSMPSGGSMLDFLQAYSSDPVIRPIVSRLQQSVSEAEWRLYVKSRTGDKQDRTPINDHALLDFLANPNPFMPFSEIVARGQQHWELVGETSIILGFQPGIPFPIDMWVLRPDRISPVPDPYEFLAGWLYTAPGDGEKIPIDVNELLRMVDPDPLDPYRGMGAVQALIRDLDATRYAKEWQGQFFANSAQPGGILEVPQILEDADFEQMSRRWAEQHQGLSKAHRVAIIESAKWVPNSFSLRDLQMAELESLGRDKTLAAFGMPKSMIGVVEDVNRANAEAGVFMFARWMTTPRLQNWRSMLNRQLLPYFDPNRQLELDFEDPVPENSDANIAELKTKADVVTELVKAGFDADAVLEMVDWPDLGYEAPAPPITQSPPPPAPSGQPGEPDGDEGMPSPNSAEPNQGEARAVVRIDNAMRWIVRGHPDDNCCEPCKEKIGTLYRNRSSAYADYPPNEGYIKCIGRQYGNKCRCHVAKRRSDRG